MFYIQCIGEVSMEKHLQYKSTEHQVLLMTSLKVGDIKSVRALKMCILIQCINATEYQMSSLLNECFPSYFRWHFQYTDIRK